jgi:exonuclease VII large subunit
MDRLMVKSLSPEPYMTGTTVQSEKLDRTINRLHGDASARQLKQDQQRFQKIESELKTTQDKPSINTTSRLLAKEQVPIHERFHKMLERKRQRVEMLSE